VCVEFQHYELRELLQHGELICGPRPWLGVNGTQRSKLIAIPARDRHPGIGNDVEIVNGGILLDKWLAPRVGHDQGLSADHHILAERVRERGPALGGPRFLEPNLTLEELPILIYEREKGDWNPKDMTGELGKPIEDLLGRSIEHACTVEGLQAPRIQ
jgi:hypothetical protein